MQPPRHRQRMLGMRQLHPERDSAVTSDVTERLRRGDEAALEVVYATHGASVRAYVSRFVPSGDVDDVVQQTFIELWRSHDRVDPGRPLIGFVLGIARRRSIDHLRRRRHDVVDVTTVRDLVGERGDEVLNQMIWASQVRAGLDQLPEEQREALVLSYFHDLTQAEIAAQLAVPLGTVKARMARGMQKLASLIDEGVLT